MGNPGFEIEDPGSRTVSSITSEIRETPGCRARAMELPALALELCGRLVASWLLSVRGPRASQAGPQLIADPLDGAKKSSR